VRDLIRLAITLATVATVSALLLTGVYVLTDPVISEREEREYSEALEQYFPGFAEFVSEQINSRKYNIIYDSAGDIMGVMATIKQQGYDGYITYNLAIDADAHILGVSVVSHSETPGLGDVITTDAFKKQFYGKGFYDPLDIGVDVNVVSGATISTSSMIISIRNVLAEVGETYLGLETQEFDLSKIADGLYRGSTDGTYGIMTVEVEVASGHIKRIEVIDHHETVAYFVEAYPLIPEKIISEQKIEVDTKTGATLSSERIVNAVRIALLQGLVDTDRSD